MSLRSKLRNAPTRLATGAYILHSGLEKWNGEPERAEGLHGFAKGAYPQLEQLPPDRFLKLLAAGEIATGTALLLPFVPSRLAGLALTAFAGGLLGLYWRTPGLHEEGSIWPTQAGIPVSKDVWMFAIGLSLLVEGGGD